MVTKRRKSKIPYIIAAILIASFFYLYIIFETTAIYEGSVDGFNEATQLLRRPTSVTEVSRMVGALDSAYTPIGWGSSATMPGSTLISNTPISAPETIGSVVATVFSGVDVYDGQTANLNGTFVSVVNAFNHHGKSLTQWYSTCFTSSSSVANSSINSRLSNPRAQNGVWIAESNAGEGGVTTRYSVAVGPGIMNPSRAQDAEPSAGEMRYGTAIDVVLEKNGKEYFIPCVVADCKAHTYPTWIVQTGYAYKGGNLYFTQAGHRDNYTTPSTYNKDIADSAYSGGAAIEFSWLQNTSNSGGFTIKGVIVYQ